MKFAQFEVIANMFSPELELAVWSDRAGGWVKLNGVAEDKGLLLLKPMDVRGMAPIEALRLMKNAAAEAHRFWDSDKDAKVGKLLLSMSGALPGYRIDMDEVHKVLDK